MIKIIFLRDGLAYRPEIDAYVKYFNQVPGFQAHDAYVHECDISGYDVIWEFKGFGGVEISENQVLVHEYASLSVAPFPKMKNLLKVWFNKKPQLRIFLNENVMRGFPFRENIEYCLRDMGIDEAFLQVNKSDNKEYDFVYVGSISKKRGMDKFLRKFSETNRIGECTICLVGDVDSDIYQLFKNDKRFIFTGAVPYSEVPKIASKAIYGINYIPDIYPYNIQTSTKLLEYLALGLKVITTDYEWVRQFEKEHNCSFYKLNRNLDLNLDEIKAHNYFSDFDPRPFLWSNVIAQAKIEQKLAEILRTRRT